MHMHDHNQTEQKVLGTSADDNLVGSSDYLSLRGMGGNDTLVGYATRLAGISGGEGDDHMTAVKTGFGQFHLYGGEGNDTIVLDNTNQATWGHHTHHAYGGDGADVFDLCNNEANDTIAVGRIDDFDPNEDVIMVDGQPIDLYDLPENMRVVLFEGQQWLQIGDSTLFALEAARVVEFGATEETERHFHEPPSDLSTLLEVDYVDPGNYISSDLYADRASELNRDVERSNSGDGLQSVVTGTDNDDFLYSVRNQDGNEHWADEIYAMGGDDVIEATKGHDTIYGGTGADILAGGQDEDFISGDSGNDILFGGAEIDLLFGGIGLDILNGGSGNDTLNGDMENDQLAGDHGDDMLSGGLGDDILNGGDGHDTLDGGAGNNVLIGGAGSDTFIVGDGADTIEDFDIASDNLIIADIQFDGARDGAEIDAVTYMQQNAYFEGDDLVIDTEDDGQIVIEDLYTTSGMGDDVGDYAGLIDSSLWTKPQEDIVKENAVDETGFAEGIEFMFLFIALIPFLVLF